MPPEMMETPPFPGIRTHSDDRASRHLPPPRLTELDGGAPSFVGDTDGCCVREAWHRRAAAGGRVELGRAGDPRVKKT